jgi:hypothetical protein
MRSVTYVFEMALAALAAISIKSIPTQNVSTDEDIPYLPLDLISEIMQRLPRLEDQLAIAQLNSWTEEVFYSDIAPTAFVNHFGIRSIDKLMRYVPADFEFGEAVVDRMPIEYLSQLINSAAHVYRWSRIRDVQFMLDRGFDANLLTYSIRRAKVHSWQDDLDELSIMVGEELVNKAITGIPTISQLLKGLQELISEQSEKFQDALHKQDIRLPNEDHPEVVNIEMLDKMLLIAAGYGAIKIVNLLLAYGANVHTSSDQAILRASEEGHLEIVRSLLDKGADVHAMDQSTPNWAFQMFLITLTL